MTDLRGTSHSRRSALRALSFALAAGVARPLAAAEAPQLYRSEEGRRAVMDLYERKLASLAVQHRSRMIETTYGHTHVLEVGDPTLPPLLALHGVHFGAPFMADFARPFLSRFRLILPDTVGQPGRSAPLQPEPRDNNYARWAAQVLDGLGLDRVPVVGTSFGGAIALDLASYAPRRISRAVLIVPGGLLRAGPVSYIPLLTKLLVPWHTYRLFPGLRSIEETVRPLAAEMDAQGYAFFDAILRHVHWLIPPPGPFSKAQLAGFTAPTAIYAARDDIFFPGEQLIADARAVLVNLRQVEIYPSSHYPTASMAQAIMPRALAFLGEGGPGSPAP